MLSSTGIVRLAGDPGPDRMIVLTGAFRERGEIEEDGEELTTWLHHTDYDIVP